MKKFFLIIFILLDIGVIAGTAWFLYNRMQGGGKAVSTAPAVVARTPAGAPGARSLLSTTTVNSALIASGTAIPPNARKIGFNYPNSHAKTVTIRADFTGWRAEPMQKDPGTNVWKYMAVLEPGEYAYCFSVDDKKPIKDPFNKRTKKVGTTFVSSIVVEAPSPPPN